MSDPNVSFVFPPFCESSFHGPHLAIPLLKAVLLQTGLHTLHFDLNIRIVRELTKKQNIKTLRGDVTRSRFSEHEKTKILAALDHFQYTELDDFLNAGSGPLRTVLKFIKGIAFPHPSDLVECLSTSYVRSEICNVLYGKFVRDIVASNPDIVCFTVAFSDQLSETIDLARRLRHLRPDTEIWLGGSQINLLHESQIERIVESRHFDRISIGNGEQTILRMLADFNTASNETLYHSGSMNFVEINKLPPAIFPSLDEYIQPITLPVLATKGCYWGKCTFCDFPQLSDLGGRAYIARSPENVLEEIIELQLNHRVDKINLISDAIPPSWYKKLCTLAIERGVKLKSWSYMMHAKSLDAGFFAHLSEAGVKAINFGTESTIDRVLDVMKKQSGFATIKANLADAQGSGIRIVTNVIPDYPTTTREEAFENASNFQELLPNIDLINPQMFDLTAGTPIEANPSGYGLSVPTTAYVKTSHGFHSRKFERTDELSKSDRKIIEHIFARLKWQTLVRRRTMEMKSLSLEEDCELMVDGSALILNSGSSHRAWIMSIGYSWSLSDQEVNCLEGILKSGSKRFRLKELLTLAVGAFGSDTKAKEWLRSLFETGIFVRTVHER
ncbi:B12-binding domain-containing radical SAM protein [Rhizobium leguminosarum]|uniref:B12-binding domain-containing radical SAM protein n=1 Tax=Rhizobium leguminosarum TaxID=384 RepID=UPI0013EF480A|nr:radical SAM protein [Rhizobium leguminosarum]